MIHSDPPSILLGDLGATCAKKVYRKPGSDTFEPTGFIQVGEARKIEADKFGGLKKAATICLYKGKPAVTGDGGVLSVIVVAIRGTASIHDWMVNFNDAALQKSTINSKLAALKVNDGTEDLIQSDFLVSTTHPFSENWGLTLSRALHKKRPHTKPTRDFLIVPNS